MLGFWAKSTGDTRYVGVAGVGQFDRTHQLIQITHLEIFPSRKYE